MKLADGNGPLEAGQSGAPTSLNDFVITTTVQPTSTVMTQSEVKNVGFNLFWILVMVVMLGALFLARKLCKK